MNLEGLRSDIYCFLSSVFR